ncbi:hypothetical protein N8I77_007488 [Diaporthe amygdali]|uniref:Uncharacterized protein n=1 Tax=Phomopsis amygdali TaxID=1214568 RepID=A0AAD9SEH3_PHOAM|nr:hypothetical protein N8I77_007488 [Diaporthe amygdali]
MRPTIPLRPRWRHNHPRRTITTAPGTFANIRYELLARPPKCYYDYLTPTNSHLLSVTLADQLAPLQARRPYPPPTSSDLDHWTLPKVHHRGGDAAAQPLPQGHHLVYFPPTHPSSALLADGTDADHWPGPPFTRRLWAGGSVSFAPHWADQLLLDKRRAACVERVEDVRLTWTRPAAAAPPADGAGDDGGSAASQAAGDKVFVDVVRRYGWVGPEEDIMGGREVVRRVEGDPAIVERRTLVFLPGMANEASPGRRNGTKPKLYQDPEFSISFTASPAVLFRFSALSFNAHAIHLDSAHCRAVEGYEKPLVHGPLLLVLMFSALKAAGAGKELTATRDLEYMNLQPLFVGEEMKVCVQPGKTKWHVWIEGGDGRLCVKGSAQLV